MDAWQVLAYARTHGLAGRLVASCRRGVEVRAYAVPGDPADAPRVIRAHRSLHTSSR